MRDPERVQGPPGPPGLPGTPGRNLWVGSHDNVVDVVEYIKCKLMCFVHSQGLSEPSVTNLVEYIR